MSSSQTEQPWLPILSASATAGALARIPLHPVDTIKCKLQTLPTQSGWALLRSTWRAEGIRGLFPGLGISVIGSAPGQTLYFTSYEMSKRVLAALPIANDHSDAVNFASGLLAETVSCVVWVPIDVVKERLQTQAALDPSLQYRGAGDALRTIAKNEGWRGFYRGYGATLLSFGPFSALYLMFYERLRALAINRRLAQGVPNARELPTSVFAMCGAAAGAGASILTNPMDIAKCRMQVERGGAVGGFSFGYRNILHGMQHIYTSEGVAGLFKGVSARVMFHAPATALTIALYEQLKISFGNVLSAREVR